MEETAATPTTTAAPAPGFAVTADAHAAIPEFQAYSAPIASFVYQGSPLP